MAIILGIDPGSRVTGFGVIKVEGNKLYYIASGCIKMTNKEFPLRLQQIFHGIKEIIAIYKPQKTAIEEVFMHTNAKTALKLGQARGAAITALVTHDLPVAEYSARVIKKAVVGYGAATKLQIQNMVKNLFKLEGKIQEDAADALAVALCHAHTIGTGALK
jgi:crossover junction endodeoxyribonuclease RuvC